MSEEITVILADGDFPADPVPLSFLEKAERIVCCDGAALALVRENVGICIMSEKCISQYPGITFVPVENWHQALYMCILYDKWLEPPVWGFVEDLVRRLRNTV